MRLQDYKFSLLSLLALFTLLILCLCLVASEFRVRKIDSRLIHEKSDRADRCWLRALYRYTGLLGSRRKIRTLSRTPKFHRIQSFCQREHCDFRLSHETDAGGMSQPTVDEHFVTAGDIVFS